MSEVMMTDASEELELAKLVPKATFIDNVGAHLKDRAPDDVLRELKFMYENYKNLEQRLFRKKATLTLKMPELQKAFDAVSLLIERREAQKAVVVEYSLADHVYAKGRIQNVEMVGLWLGANVMLEYSVEEASELLGAQLSGCKENLQINTRELQYIKDQITTTEVTLARIYNHDVVQRRTERKPMET